MGDSSPRGDRRPSAATSGRHRHRETAPLGVVPTPASAPGHATRRANDPHPRHGRGGRGRVSRVAATPGADRAPHRRLRAAAAGRQSDRRAVDAAVRGPPVHRAADRAAGDVRGPGRHRHRERPAVRGAGAAQRRASGEQSPGHRGAGAADRHGRDPAGHRLVADRCAAVLDADRPLRQRAARRGLRDATQPEGDCISDGWR